MEKLEKPGGMLVLTDAIVAILKRLPFRADAKLIACLVPIGSICWEDEEAFRTPDWHKLSKDEQLAILRLFGVRFQIWDDEPLSAEDRKFWEAARAQVPTFALFYRLKLSAEDREARKMAEEATDNWWGPEATYRDA